MKIKKLLAAAAMTAIAVLGPISVATHASAKPISATSLSAQETELSEKAKECIEAVEKSGNPDDCQKAPNPILPATSELILGTLAFVLVFLLLWKVAVPGLNKSMEARSSKIEGELASAEKAKTDATEQAASYTSSLGDSKAQGDKIVDEARAQAETVKKDIISRAETEAAQIRQKAADDSAAQSDRLKGELESYVKTMSVNIAEKVVGSSLDGPTSSALVDKYIAEMAR